MLNNIRIRLLGILNTGIDGQTTQCEANVHQHVLWYDQNKLVINKSKSSVMLATTRQRILHIDDNNLDTHIRDYKLVQSD